MSSNHYDEFVSSLLKPAKTILAELTVSKVNLGHCSAGLAGEAGEVADELKKHIYTNKPLNMEKLIKELGDVEFYLQGIRTELGLTRDQVIKANILKLCERFPDGYQDKAVVDRIDTSNALDNFEDELVSREEG